MTSSGEHNNDKNVCWVSWRCCSKPLSSFVMSTLFWFHYLLILLYVKRCCRIFLQLKRHFMSLLSSSNQRWIWNDVSLVNCQAFKFFYFTFKKFRIFHRVYLGPLKFSRVFDVFSFVFSSCLLDSLLLCETIKWNCFHDVIWVFIWLDSHCKQLEFFLKVLLLLIS